MKKQLRFQVAEDLYSPSLLRRILRKWAYLPAAQEHERAIEVACEQMKLHIYGGFTITRWKGFVEWRRAHRGFFKLILGAWRHWAQSHKHASALAITASSRHRVTCLAQHFEILQQHTTYRRRLNATATIKMQEAQKEYTRTNAKGCMARLALLAFRGDDAQALAVAAFRAWHLEVSGRKALDRFRSHVDAAHSKRLLEMIFVRWLIASRGEKTSPEVQQQYIARWQKTIAAYGWPLPAGKIKELHKIASTTSRMDLADAKASAKAAASDAQPFSKVAPPGPISNAAAPAGSTSNATDAPAAVTDAPAKEGKDKWGSTEVGRLGQMPAILMWQALATIAPPILRQRKGMLAKLKKPLIDRLRDKRDETHWTLPKFAIRRAMLLGLQGLAEAKAADTMRRMRRRDDLLLLAGQSEDSAKVINSYNPKFTLIDRAAPPERVGSAGKKGKGGSKSARGGKSPKRPGSGKRPRTPPPLPVARPDFDEASPAQDEDGEDAFAHLPSHVPRSCHGRPRPPSLPVLPWEMSEAEREALEESRRRMQNGEGEKVAALSALRALASKHIVTDGGTTSDLEKEVFDTEMKAALEEGWEGQQISTGGSLALSAALSDATAFMSGDMREHGSPVEQLDEVAEEEEELDAGETDEEEGEEEEGEEMAPLEIELPNSRPASADASDNSKTAALGETMGASAASAASAAALASVRMLMGASSRHFIPVEQQPNIPPEELKRQLVHGYHKARAALGEWAEEKELEELARLRARALEAGGTAMDLAHGDQPQPALSLAAAPSEDAGPALGMETIAAAAPSEPVEVERDAAALDSDEDLPKEPLPEVPPEWEQMPTVPNAVAPAACITPTSMVPSPSSVSVYDPLASKETISIFPASSNNVSDSIAPPVDQTTSRSSPSIFQVASPETEADVLSI